jgi:hypothetical protein
VRSSLRRKIVSFDKQIALRPLPQNNAGSFCMVCKRAVDSEEIVSEYRGIVRNGVKVLVRCHDAEEIATFEFGSEHWDETDIKRAMQRVAWFSPSHEDMGGVLNGGRIN